MYQDKGIVYVFNVIKSVWVLVQFNFLQLHGYTCMLLIMYEKVHFIKLQLKIGQVVNV